MAVAEARLTGKPAVFLVSRGPGATNGSIAVHVAEQDATPVLLFIGQVSREERNRGAFQEMAQADMAAMDAPETQDAMAAVDEYSLTNCGIALKTSGN